MSSIKKQQKKQLYKEGQAAAQSIKKYYAPKVTQLGPTKPARLTVSREIRRSNEQPSTNTLNKTKTERQNAAKIRKRKRLKK